MPDSSTHFDGGWDNPIDQKEGRSLRIDKPSCERVDPKLFCFSKKTGHLGKESQRPGASLTTERTRNCRNIPITLIDPGSAKFSMPPLSRRLWFFRRSRMAQTPREQARAKSLPGCLSHCSC